MSALPAWLDLLAREGVELLLASSAACLLVLLLRLPVRRAFGARVAYALWWLLPAAMLAVLLPAPVAAPAGLSVVAGTGSSGTVPLMAGTMQAEAAWLDIKLLLGLLWALGALAATGLLAARQRRFERALGRIEPLHDGLW